MREEVGYSVSLIDVALKCGEGAVGAYHGFNEAVAIECGL